MVLNSWLSQLATGARIIVYILMASFCQNMAFQPTDLHCYTQFYAIPVPSDGSRHGQPTQTVCTHLHIRQQWQSFCEQNVTSITQKCHEAVHHRKMLKGGETKLLLAHYMKLQYVVLRKNKMSSHC